MGKGKRQKSQPKKKPPQPLASQAAETTEEEEVVGEPPGKNFPLLALSAAAFGAWLVYLIYLASRS